MVSSSPIKQPFPDRPIVSAAIRLPWWPLAVAAAALAGCNRNDVRIYVVAKEGPPAAVSAPTVAKAPEEEHLAWSIPPGWASQPASGMRLASLSVADASGGIGDISIVTFPGAGGDDLANLNRWRRQLKLEAVNASDLTTLVSVIETPAGRAGFVDIGSADSETPKSRMLGAWVRSATQVWFFKLTGPAVLVAGQKTAFVDFLKTLHFTSAQAAASAEASRAAIPAVKQPASGQTQVAWSALSLWTAGPPSSMRKASYLTAMGAEVSVSAFPGDVGGMLANVNRWRAQVGLEALESSALSEAVTDLKVGGSTLNLVTIGPSDGKEIVVAIYSGDDATWFFKLNGETNAVERSKEEFQQFLKTLKFQQPAPAQ